MTMPQTKPIKKYIFYTYTYSIYLAHQRSAKSTIYIYIYIFLIQNMNSSSITITAWNINGLRHRTLGNKLSNSDFTKNIKDHDLIFLVETWSNQTDSIPGFKAVSTCTATPKTNSSCRISGGITLLIKNTLQPLIYTEKLTKNFLWCRIDKSILDSPHHLFICGVYYPSRKITIL